MPESGGERMAGKAAAGDKRRGSSEVAAGMVKDMTAKTLQGPVERQAQCRSAWTPHESVCHSVGECVRDDLHAKKTKKRGHVWSLTTGPGGVRSEMEVA